MSPTQMGAWEQRRKQGHFQSEHETQSNNSIEAEHICRQMSLGSLCI